MGKKVMTKVEKSIHEESEKISEARRAIKAQKNIIDNSDIIPEELDDKDWREKEFSFPNNTVRIGTVFSGIGAIEHAFQRLKLKHKIIFAGDIDANCKKSYFANYEINEEDWFTDVREFDASKYRGKVDFVIGGAPCQAFSMVGKRLGFEDARGTLFYEFARIVKETNPKVFLIKNQIKPYLGDRPLSALTTQELQKFYNTVKKKGRVKPDKRHGTELADSMVRGIHMMLHEALDMAVRLRLIVKNPTVGTTIPKNNYPPKQILNDEQLERFMQRIRQDERWYDFFYTELTTGLRRGEICGLKWEDFDAENGKLKVRRSVAKRKGGGLNIGETKTETGTRTIVLPPSTAELLRKRKETAVSEWIFPNIYEPEKPMHPDYAYHRLKTLLKQAELPLIRFHDLRHTFATHALAGGVDAKTLSGILGHTNASFTLDTYTHVTTDMQRNASAIVGSFMDEIMLEGDDTNR